MKRRNFIVSASIIAVGLPVAYYVKKNMAKPDPLMFPEFLGLFCKEQEIKAIGKKYRGMVPAENGKQKLKELILAGDNGKQITSSDKSGIINLIREKTQKEFSSFNTIIVNGWIISVTEARQCALFSFS